jgi:hypothetical protein
MLRSDPLTRPTTLTGSPTIPTRPKRRALPSAPAVAGWGDWASASAGGGRYVNLSTLDTSKTLSGLGGRALGWSVGSGGRLVRYPKWKEPPYWWQGARPGDGGSHVALFGACS